MHLYESEDFLRDVVVDFLVEGIAAATPVLVYATRRHWEMFCETLTQRGFSTADGIARGTLSWFDAEATLERVTVDGALDAMRFEEVVGAAVRERARLANGGRVQVFGEIVDLLWHDGKAKVAVELEELWSALQSHVPFRLLCAYRVTPASDLDELRELCATHSRVWPSHSSSAIAIPTPQQMLTAEVQHRRRVEAALRQCIRDLRDAQHELEEREREQRERARFNEMLVAILGHDLRNPLGAIMSATRLVLDRMPDEERVKPLRWALNSGDRMARMIDQLLDFTHTRVSDGIPLERKETALDEVVAAAVDEAHARTARAVRVERRGDLTGQFDPDRLAQVFSNLIGNALQHGDPSAPVEVSLDGEAADWIVATVRNGGVVPEELLPTLFEPFAGEHRSRGGRRGLGLGLFITRAIVVRHGGSVDVSSTRQTGATTFTLRLPRHPGAHSN